MDINPYDAIVVGSGATGGVAALTLAQQGIRVLIIEAGPQIKRERLVVMSLKIPSKDYQELF